MGLLPGYFIAPNLFGELCIWRESDDEPVSILWQGFLREDPAVWDVLAAAIRTVDA